MTFLMDARVLSESTVRTPAASAMRSPVAPAATNDSPGPTGTPDR